jgi:predicted RNA-binding protein with PUA domain
MKIVICGSMSSAKKMVEIEKELKLLGHKVVLPKHTKEYAEGSLIQEDGRQSVKNKIEYDLIREYFREIKKSDAILVANFTKNKIKNYIGGNAFLEIGFAHVLNKKIFLLNKIPKMIYSDEIEATQLVVINNDFSKIR